jgi:hypothetical protein
VIGSDADNYIDGSYNLSAILKLIYPHNNNKKDCREDGMLVVVLMLLSPSPTQL